MGTFIKNASIADDDLFLSSATGLNEESTSIVYLDVLANDGGGKAKVLWSIDNAVNSLNDLVIQDLSRSEATSLDASLNGARIWITNDGKVGYDASSLSASFRASLQSLAVGEVATDTFTYAIRVGNGTLSSATATVYFAGLNDAPAITAEAGDSAGQTFAETNAGLQATGTLTVRDVDTSDQVTASLVGVTHTGPTGGLTDTQLLNLFHITAGTIVDAEHDSGKLTWTFNSGSEAFDFLDPGESLVLHYTIRPNDGQGTTYTGDGVVTITVNGTADAHGAFALDSSIQISGSARDVTIADLNSDGIADIVGSCRDSPDSIGVLIGNGDGTYSGQNLPGGGTHSVAVADLNSDGIMDILGVGDGAGHNTNVYLGNGDNTWQGPVNVGNYISVGVAIADFNGDGFPDLAGSKLSNANFLSVMLGNNDGTFGPEMTFDAGSVGNEIKTADFNGDQKADLLVANSGEASVSVLLGNGDGTFQSQTAYATGASPNAVAVADFNNDAILDFASANTSNQSATVHLGRGDGTFAWTSTFYSGGNIPTDIEVGDFDADGNVDLVLVNQPSNNVSIFSGHGDGNFDQTASYAADTPWSVAVGDLNGDGYADLAVTEFFTAKVQVLLNVPPDDFIT